MGTPLFPAGNPNAREFIEGLTGTATGQANGQFKEQSLSFNTIDDLVNHYKDLANKGDEVAIEKLFNYLVEKESTENARSEAYKREDTVWQRLVQDLSKAGISPYILSGGAPSSSGAIKMDYKGTEYSSKVKNDESNRNDIIRSVMSLLGTVLMASMLAL